MQHSWAEATWVAGSKGDGEKGGPGGGGGSERVRERDKMLRQKLKDWRRKLQNRKDKDRCERLRQKLKGWQL